MLSKPPPVRDSSNGSRRNDVDGNAIHNRILSQLPAKDCDLVVSRLTFVNLALHEVLHEAGDVIRYCYFPNTAMASILNVMDDGKSVEVGLAGWEGFVGMPIVAGFRTGASRVVTQAQGNAFRTSADDLRKSLQSCPNLITSLFRYSQEMAMEVSQVAACNRLHGINERLARWLLMSQDRIRSEKLPLTQEFLGQMLGTRRSSVSVAAAVLQNAGLIRYSRGHVSILNRAGLESASCECYQAIQQQLENWRRESAAAS